jgi:hypothetical protein
MKTRPEQLKRILKYKLRQKYRISSGTKSGFRNKSAVGVAKIQNFITIVLNVLGYLDSFNVMLLYLYF